jgi:branched-chain amino acid transport system substrate-binding protein
MSRKTRYRYTALAAVAATATLAVAACSSSSSSSSSSPPSSASSGSTSAASAASTASSSSSASKSPVVFAAMGPNSGSEYNPGPQSTKNQYEALAAAWNSVGGIDGHPIELNFYDTESSAAVAVQIVPKVESSGAKAFFSCCFAAESQAADAKTSTEGPVTFNADPNIPMPAGSYLFDATMPATEGLAATEKFIGLKGWKKVALLTDTTPGEDTARDSLTAAAAANGYSVTTDQIFDVSATSLATQIAQIAATKPDAVVLWSVGPQIATAFSAIESSSLANTPVLLADGDLNLAILKKTASTLPANTYAPGAYYLVAQSGGVPANEAAVLKYFLKAQGFTGSTDDNVASYLVDSFNVAVAALEHLGVNATNQQILNYVQTLSGFQGINGVYHFSPANHTGLSGLTMGMVKVAPNTLDLTPVANAGVTKLLSSS